MDHKTVLAISSITFILAYFTIQLNRDVSKYKIYKTKQIFTPPEPTTRLTSKQYNDSIEEPTQLVPDRKNIDLLQLSPGTELKRCALAEIPCDEPEQIKTLKHFDYRIPLESYQKSLIDPRLRTNAKHTQIYKLNNRKVIITAHDGNGNLKTHGGDYFIARLSNYHLGKPLETNNLGFEGIFVPGIVVDLKNGSYSVDFPDISHYSNHFDSFHADFWLEMSAESVEFNRRALSSHVTLSRIVKVKYDNGGKMETCGYFNRTGYCDLSKKGSKSGSWFCSQDNFNCETQKRLENNSYLIGNKFVRQEWLDLVVDNKFDVIGELVDTVAYPFFSVGSSDPEHESSKIFDHWFHGEWVSKVQLDTAVILPNKTSRRYLNFHHPEWKISKTLADSVSTKLRGKTLIYFGDSLGAQIFNELKRALAETSKFNCESKVFKFWGFEFNPVCRPDVFKMSSRNTAEYLGKNPQIMECADKLATGMPNTVMARFNHGRMMHYGGCFARLQYTIDNLDHLETRGVFLKNPESILFFSFGAHFSFVNHIVLYDRLVELRDKLKLVHEKHPKLQIIFKKVNFWKGKFSIQQGVVSSFNSKRINGIFDEIFSGVDFVKMMGGTFEMTEVIHDMLTHGHEGIHPGQYNGAYGKQSCAFLPTNLVREFLKMVY